MIVYTCVTKTDCPLPIQDYLNLDKHKFICFHSVPIQTKQKFWEYIPICEIDNDPLLTIKSFKLLSHELFQEDTCWVDPKNIIFNIPSTKSELLILHNHFKHNFIDELIDWLILPCINFNQAFSILKYFYDKNCKIDKIGITSNVLYRKYTAKMVRHNILWFKLWKKFKIRDQLPFYLSSQKMKINYQISKTEYVGTPENQPSVWYNPNQQKQNYSKVDEFLKIIQEYYPEYKISKKLLDWRRYY